MLYIIWLFFITRLLCFPFFFCCLQFSGFARFSSIYFAFVGFRIFRPLTNLNASRFPSSKKDTFFMSFSVHNYWRICNPQGSHLCSLFCIFLILPGKILIAKRVNLQVLVFGVFYSPTLFRKFIFIENYLFIYFSVCLSLCFYYGKYLNANWFKLVVLFVVPLNWNHFLQKINTKSRISFFANN